MASRIQPFFNIAHGGAPLLCPPPQTAASLRKAVEVGADMLEVSVRHTRDDVLVLDHEAVRMVAGREIPLTERSYAAWQALAGEGEETLTTLDEAFQIATDLGVGLLLNYRDTGVETLFARKIRNSGFPLEKLLVSGASEAIRKILRILEPRIPFAQTLEMEDLGRVSAKLLTEVDTDAVCWHYHLLSPAVVKVLQLRGIVVYAHSVELAEDMRRMRDAGVDGIITSQPDILAKI